MTLPLGGERARGAGAQGSAHPGKRHSYRLFSLLESRATVPGLLAHSSPTPGLSPPVLWAGVGDKAEEVRGACGNALGSESCERGFLPGRPLCAPGSASRRPSRASCLGAEKVFASLSTKDDL